jgi:hypothetical protein
MKVMSKFVARGHYVLKHVKRVFVFKKKLTCLGLPVRTPMPYTQHHVFSVGVSQTASDGFWSELRNSWLGDGTVTGVWVQKSDATKADRDMLGWR